MTTTEDDPRLESMPSPPRERPRWLVLVAVVVVLAAGTLFGGYRYLRRSIDPPGPPGEDVQLTIARGQSIEEIAEVLETNDVIRNARIFAYWSKVQGKGPYLPGSYSMPERSSYEEVARILSRGPEVDYDRLTIPEGFTIEQIAERVGRLPGRDANKFKELATNGTVTSPLQPPGVRSLEGLLFPSTYFIGEKDDEARILRRMVDGMVRVARSLDLEQGAAEHRLTPYQVITIASLVEKEAKIEDERPLVAEVVYNRLERNQRLEIDATVIYAMGQAGKKTRVTRDDLKFRSPYNTYQNPGLPPGPIAAPGEASLRAALEPAEGNGHLFYVVVAKDGRHAFARTFEEHQANIRKAEQAGVR